MKTETQAYLRAAIAAIIEHECNRPDWTSDAVVAEIMGVIEGRFATETINLLEFLAKNIETRKIEAIKEVRSVTGAGLKISKDLVESFPGSVRYDTRGTGSFTPDSVLVNILHAFQRDGIPGVEKSLSEVYDVQGWPLSDAVGAFRRIIMGDASKPNARFGVFVQTSVDDTFGAGKIESWNLVGGPNGSVGRDEAMDIGREYASDGKNVIVAEIVGKTKPVLVDLAA